MKPVLERLQKLFGIESAEQHVIAYIYERNQYELIMISIIPFSIFLQKFAVSGTVSNVKRVRERLQNLFGIESAEEYVIVYICERNQYDLTIMSTLFSIFLQKFAASGTIMCKAMVENINYDEFFRELDMPNTFNSWYRVTELHIWLLMVCAMAEKANGIYLRNQIVRALWKEVETKLERNYGMTYSILHQYNSLHYDYFTPSTIEYDDGLLSADDTMLANAIWRNFYDSNCDDIEKIELLVKYVRKTVGQ